MYKFIMVVVSVTTFTPVVCHVDRVGNYWDNSSSFWVKLSDYIPRHHIAKRVLHPSLFCFLFKLVNASCVRLHNFLSCVVLYPQCYCFLFWAQISTTPSPLKFSHHALNNCQYGIIEKAQSSTSSVLRYNWNLTLSWRYHFCLPVKCSLLAFPHPYSWIARQCLYLPSPSILLPQ